MKIADHTVCGSTSIPAFSVRWSSSACKSAMGGVVEVWPEDFLGEPTRVKGQWRVLKDDRSGSVLYHIESDRNEAIGSDSNGFFSQARFENFHEEQIE